MKQHDASIFLRNMPARYYFDRPCNLTFHDMTNIMKPPPNLRSLLRLELKFCPDPWFTTYQTSKILPQFDRDLRLKTYFAGKDKNDYNSKMYVPGTSTPPDFMIPKEILR
eukprot:8294281-Ditylum_brightwellii.AAC.1